MELQPSPRLKLSSTQKGSIGEAVVGAQLMLASHGRLSPFRPLADDDGTDLLVADKLTGRVVHVQVKASYSSEAEAPPKVQFDIRRATFRIKLDSFVLAALLDPASGGLWRAWLIPTAELAAISIIKPHKYSITPNPSLASRDRYVPWRYRNMEELVGRLVGSSC